MGWGWGGCGGGVVYAVALVFFVRGVATVVV